MKNEATGKPLTVEQEMAKFSGFTTNNGETVKPDKTAEGPGDRNLDDSERAAGVTVVNEQSRTAAPGAKKTTTAAAAAPGPKAAAVPVVLTDEESTAALEKGAETLGVDSVDELTDEEKADVLDEALKSKKAAATKQGPSGDARVTGRVIYRAINSAPRRAVVAPKLAPPALNPSWNPLSAASLLLKVARRP